MTAGYHEDRYFRPGDTGYPVVDVGRAGVGLPTCWDQWFPELARAYSLAGADVLVYPTAIGSEPDHPDFDTQPLWQQVIVGNGIANGLAMVAVNRTGTETMGGHVDHVLRLVVHQRPLRAHPRAGPRDEPTPCSWPTSISTPAATGSTCSRSSPPAAPTPTARSPDVPAAAQPSRTTLTELHTVATRRTQVHQNGGRAASGARRRDRP